MLKQVSLRYLTLLDGSWKSILEIMRDMDIDELMLHPDMADSKLPPEYVRPADKLKLVTDTNVEVRDVVGQPEDDKNEDHDVDDQEMGGQNGKYGEEGVNEDEENRKKEYMINHSYVHHIVRAQDVRECLDVHVQYFEVERMPPGYYFDVVLFCPKKKTGAHTRPQQQFESILRLKRASSDCRLQ